MKIIPDMLNWGEIKCRDHHLQLVCLFLCEKKVLYRSITINILMEKGQRAILEREKQMGSKHI